MNLSLKIFSIAAQFPYILPYREGTPLGCSIDITNACNLRCKHCYYFMKEYQQSVLTDEQWIEKIRWIKKEHPTIIHCTWVGGEPLIPNKRELLEQGIKEFVFNWVVTNGTWPIPKLENTAFFVSIDGTEKYHDFIRGKGIYEKIKKNISESSARIFIHAVINAKNAVSIPDLLEEWHHSNVRGIIFSFHTPMPGVKDPLYIKPSERDKIVNGLIGLKKKYKDFISMSKKHLELFLSENYKQVIDDNARDKKNCMLKKGTVISFDSDGRIKYPCVMGDMDCSRCGCTIPYLAYATFIKNDFESMKIMAKTFF